MNHKDKKILSRFVLTLLLLVGGIIIATTFTGCRKDEKYRFQILIYGNSNTTKIYSLSYEVGDYKVEDQYTLTHYNTIPTMITLEGLSYMTKYKVKVKPKISDKYCKVKVQWYIDSPSKFEEEIVTNGKEIELKGRIK